MAKEVDTKGYVKAYRKMQDTEVFKKSICSAIVPVLPL